MGSIESRCFPRLPCAVGAWCCVLLAACGGGGGAPGALPAAPAAPAPSAVCAPPTEGLPLPTVPAIVGGTIVGRKDSSFIFVSLGDGWRPLLFYGPDLASTPSVTGFVAANYDGWSCSAPDPTAYNGIDRGRQSHDRVYMYTAVTSNVPLLTGTIRYASATYSLTGGPVPGSTYNVGAPPQVADVVGAWTMTNHSGALTELAVDANGTLTGSDQGCALAGTATPSEEGLNLLRLQLTVSQCPSRPNTLSSIYDGFALALPLTGGGTQVLIWAETSNGVDFDYVLAIGRR
jgi:hypothetical protein